MPFPLTVSYIIAVLPTRFSGIRTRILAIALVPSVVLLVVGIGTTIPLVNEGRRAEELAHAMVDSREPTRDLYLAVQQERLLSLWRLAGQEPNAQALADARIRFDKALEGLAPMAAELRSLAGPDMAATVDAHDQLRAELPNVRRGIDTGTMPLTEAYTFFNQLIKGANQGIAIIERTTPHTPAAVKLIVNVAVLRVLEAMSRTSALTAAATNRDGLSPELLGEYRDLTGYYRAELANLTNDLDAVHAQRVEEILQSPAWQRMSAGVESVTSMNRSDSSRSGESSNRAAAQSPPIDVADWGTAAEEVRDQMLTLFLDYTDEGEQIAATAAERQTRDALLRGAAVLALAVLAFVLSLWLANRLADRLKRLRSETLALAQEHLPDTMRRLEAGEDIDLADDETRLNFGTDEIGQVAQAFNQAHAAAVTAAVTEARTREGVRAVFLNIAHRSQLVVHQQLEILDKAELRQEDPALLEIFFRLDHLATRERRNAENLIILGGGRPGRQWRRPVPLLELVRSAVGETLNYTRVHTGVLPDVHVIGGMVTDFIHLLAELADNATSFSPPQSRVNVTGSVVGKGVVVEIIDQGTGLPEAELQRLNGMLSDPTDFGLAALATDFRLGMFVVAHLAQRHGISVRLTESDYGGVRAIVLVPSALIATEPTAVDHLPPHPVGRRADPPVTGEIPISRLDQTSALSASTATLPPRARHSSTEPPNDPPARPSLPKRHRQSSLAPELADRIGDTGPAAPPPRTAEQARDLMSAIENGTRQGRRPTSDPSSATQWRPTAPQNDQDRDDDLFNR